MSFGHMKKMNAAIIVCGMALAAFAVMAALVQTGAMRAVDVRVGEWVRAHETDGLTRLMRFVAALSAVFHEALLPIVPAEL